MKNGLLIIILSFVSLAACNEEKKEIKQEVTVEDGHDGVSVIVEGVFKENDNIAVYYNKEDHYSGENINQLVLGSCEIQKLTFDLPEDVEPEQIKILLSRNPAQKEISIKNITVKFQNDSIDGSNGKFVNFFSLKEQVQYDKTTFKYLLNADGKPYHPWIGGGSDFKHKLSSLMSTEGN